MNDARLLEYLDKALKSFDDDPPEGDYQRGYKAAIENVREEVCRHG
jgi:hypothetical protein